MDSKAAFRAAERASFWTMYERMHATITHEATHEDGSMVRVYQNATGKLAVVAFGGTAGKPAFHYSMRSQAIAEDYAARFIAGRAQHVERRAARKAERGAWKTALQVGTVLRESWGYDQTNIDYYQVIEISPSGRTCVIREIAARSVGPSMTGSCWPLADEFIGKPMRKMIGERDAIKVREWGSWAYPWEPKADHWTAYA